MPKLPGDGKYALVVYPYNHLNCSPDLAFPAKLVQAIIRGVASGEKLSRAIKREGFCTTLGSSLKSLPPKKDLDKEFEKQKPYFCVDVQKNVISLFEGKTKIESMPSGMRPLYDKLIEKAKQSNLKSIEPEEVVLEGPDRALIYEEFRPAFTHGKYDPIIESFEKGYHAQRASIEAIIKDIKASIPKDIGYYICKDASRVDFVVTGKHNNEVLVATIHMGDARFKKKTPEKQDPAIVDVYHHVQSGREYVKDVNNVFVRRYLVRNLSEDDKVSVSKSEGLKSRWLADKKVSLDPNKEDVNAAILKHLRAAQGGSDFISLTSTRRMIFGSAGADFYVPKKGRIVVDAAQLETEQIYDVHTLPAIAKIIANKDLEFGVKFEEGNDEKNRNAAARDTVRTREVLVLRHVPKGAIVAHQDDSSSSSSSSPKPKWRDPETRLELKAEDEKRYECP